MNRARCTLAMTTALAACTPAWAAPPLFRALEARQAAVAEPPAISRQRVEVAVDLLEGAAKRLELRLPTGEAVVAALHHLERRGPGDLAWRGRLENASGEVTLTLKHGLVDGTIWVRDRMFELRPLADRGQTLDEADPMLVPECRILELEDTLVGRDGEALTPRTGSTVTRAAGELVTIDVMSLYTNQALAGAGGLDQLELSIQGAVDRANTAFANSRMTARFRLVHVGSAGRDDSGDVSRDINWAMNDPAVRAVRDAFAADLVSLIVETDANNGCGLGTLMTRPGPDFAIAAFQVTRRGCLGNLVFAHEHGHNMGMNHNPENGPAPEFAAFPWSYGHWHLRQYRTVMAYGDQCEGCLLQPYFSNPEVTPAAYPGLPSGIADERDNRRTGDLTAPIVAAFRPLDVPLVSGAPVDVSHPVSGTFRYYYLDVPPGSDALKVAASGGLGEADLYVAADGKPTLDEFDCGSSAPGNDETCTVTSPAPGRWWIGVYPHGPYADLRLVASFSDEAIAAPASISGPSSATLAQRPIFTALGASSSSGHALQHQFDWGDGSASGWGNALGSKVYSEAGVYEVRARARCASHPEIESPWSAAHILTIAVPAPPFDGWIASGGLPGFEAQVRITGGGIPYEGRAEADCIAETICVSGALAGRPEVFIKVIGPRPNGYLWVQAPRFTPSEVEIWLRRAATGELEYYRLAASGSEGLVGLEDREAFLP